MGTLRSPRGENAADGLFQQPVRVGVAGVGYLGTHHARIYSEIAGALLVGVHDIDPQRAAEVAQRHGAAAFRDLDALLREVDAVSIVVPTPAHYAVARACLAAGRDLLLEKPMAASLAEADDLVRLAEDRGAILQIGHVERFNGAVQALRDRLADPRFMEVHRLGNFAERGTDTSVVLDLMIHDIDLLLSLVCSPVRDLRAVGVPVISDEVDIANARLEFENGAVANVTASRVSSERVRKLRIFQADTYLSLDFQSQELRIARKIPDPSGGRPRIVSEKAEILKSEPLREELQAFLGSVRHRHPPAVSGKEGREALSIAFRVQEQVARYARDARRAGGEQSGRAGGEQSGRAGGEQSGRAGGEQSDGR